MPKQETIFRISVNNRGVACPFKAIVCPGATATNAQYTSIGRSGEKW